MYLSLQEKPVKIPWKPIIFAFILFTVGSLSITFGVLILIGHIDEKYSDRMWPLLILGSLMFIPGAYHTYLAFYAFRGCQGFDFSDIPTYGDDWYWLNLYRHRFVVYRFVLWFSRYIMFTFHLYPWDTLILIFYLWLRVHFIS